jgi:hypothetical protein
LLAPENVEQADVDQKRLASFGNESLYPIGRNILVDYYGDILLHRWETRYAVHQVAVGYLV